jgi:hypothetical protein
VLGDDREVKVVGCGTVSFQRESLPPMSMTKVLYVPCLKKNLVSVSAIEERAMRSCSMMGRCSFTQRGLVSLRPK